MKKVLQPSALLHLLAAFFSGLPPRRFVVVENLPFGMISGSRTEPPGYLARPYAARLYEHGKSSCPERPLRWRVVIIHIQY